MCRPFIEFPPTDFSFGWHSESTFVGGLRPVPSTSCYEGSCSPPPHPHCSLCYHQSWRFSAGPPGGSVLPCLGENGCRLIISTKIVARPFPAAFCPELSDSLLLSQLSLPAVSPAVWFTNQIYFWHWWWRGEKLQAWWDWFLWGSLSLACRWRLPMSSRGHTSVVASWALFMGTRVTLDQGPLTDPRLTLMASLMALLPNGDTDY